MIADLTLIRVSSVLAWVAALAKNLSGSLKRRGRQESVGV